MSGDWRLFQGTHEPSDEILRLPRTPSCETSGGSGVARSGMISGPCPPTVATPCAGEPTGPALSPSVTTRSTW